MQKYACVLIMLALATTMSLAGCASSGVQRQDTAVTSLKQLRTDMNSGAQQVDATVASLRGVLRSQDLVTSYNEFTKQLKQLERDAATVRSRRASMKTKVDQYIESWRAEFENVQNADARRSTEERAASYRIAVGRVENALDDVKNAYGPFISDLKDIQLILTNDLSKRGVSGLSSTIEGAIEKSAALKNAIGQANIAIGGAYSEFDRGGTE